jgi:ketosteroid isomerase-like protein
VSETNAEIAAAALEAFNAGDSDRLQRLAGAEIEVFSPANMANSGRYVGRAGFTSWMDGWMEAWQSFTVEALRSETIGDRFVVTRVLQHGTGRGSGIETSMETTYFFEIRDGRIVRFHIYSEHADALAMADG